MKDHCLFCVSDIHIDVIRANSPIIFHDCNFTVVSLHTDSICHWCRGFISQPFSFWTTEPSVVPVSPVRYQTIWSCKELVSALSKLCPERAREFMCLWMWCDLMHKHRCATCFLNCWVVSTRVTDAMWPHSKMIDLEGIHNLLFRQSVEIASSSEVADYRQLNTPRLSRTYGGH